MSLVIPKRTCPGVNWTMLTLRKHQKCTLPLLAGYFQENKDHKKARGVLRGPNKSVPGSFGGVLGGVTAPKRYKMVQKHQKPSFTWVRPLFAENQTPPKCSGSVGRPSGIGPGSFRGVPHELWSKNVGKPSKKQFYSSSPIIYGKSDTTKMCGDSRPNR